MHLPVRKTDPQTSYEAAKRMLPRRGKVAKAVWATLIQTGPVTHDSLLAAYNRNVQQIPGWPPASDSSIRTRCKELSDLGLVERLNADGVSDFGNRAHLWRALTDAEIRARVGTRMVTETRT